MPLLHRLACFRDDVIFVIYLYQMRIYKVDKTRVNEFGQGGDDEEVDAKIAADPLKAPAGGEVATETAVDGKGDAEVREKGAGAKAVKASGASAGGSGRKRSTLR